jgi:hypothetical protein
MPDIRKHPEFFYIRKIVFNASRIFTRAFSDVAPAYDFQPAHLNEYDIFLPSNNKE